MAFLAESPSPAPNLDRRALLRQRFTARDNNDSNSATFLKDPSSSIGLEGRQPANTEKIARSYSEVQNHTSGGEIPTTHTTSASMNSISTALLAEELKAKLAEQVKKIQEQEKQIERARLGTISLVTKHIQISSVLQSYVHADKERRLGTFMATQTGSTKWYGGQEVTQIQIEIASTEAKLQAIKKGGQRALLMALLKSQKETLERLESEREEWALQQRLYHDSSVSKYQPTQTLNDGRYVLTEFIGRGGFSEVWKAFDLKDGKEVAIKIQKMKKKWSEKEKKAFIRHLHREIIILDNTDHPNVVKFYNYFFIADPIVAMVMEHCEGGDLAQLIRRRGRMSEKEGKAILVQIIMGMGALRTKQEIDSESEHYVIHYDLKPANILFDKDYVVKVTDFGLSKIVDNDESAIMLTSQGTGTYYYAAPETFIRPSSNDPSGGIMINSAVDTWSLGVIYYEMLYGTRPYGVNVKQVGIISMIADEGQCALSFPTAIKVSKEAQQFIQTCLTRDPRTRPQLKNLLTDPYVKSCL